MTYDTGPTGFPTETDIAVWQTARDVIDGTLAVVMKRFLVSGLTETEVTLLDQLTERLKAEYTLLEPTDRDVIDRVIRDYLRLSSVISEGRFLEDKKSPVRRP